MSEPQTVTIVLVDDQAIVRAAFQSLLERIPRFRVVGSAPDARQGIELVQRLRPALVLLDITMPGMSGIDALAPLKKAWPGTRVLIASQLEGQKYVRQAMEAGADGYLSKDSEPEELELAIDAILSGESYVSPKVAGTLAPGSGQEVAGDSPLASLTPREREVFQLIAIGKPNKEIASVLGLSLGTVKKHRENLQRKLDCRSAAEMARLAIREGLLGP